MPIEWHTRSHRKCLVQACESPAIPQTCRRRLIQARRASSDVEQCRARWLMVHAAERQHTHACTLMSTVRYFREVHYMHHTIKQAGPAGRPAGDSDAHSRPEPWLGLGQQVAQVQCIDLCCHDKVVLRQPSQRVRRQVGIHLVVPLQMQVCDATV